METTGKHKVEYTIIKDDGTKGKFTRYMGQKELAVLLMRGEVTLIGVNRPDPVFIPYKRKKSNKQATKSR